MTRWRLGGFAGVIGPSTLVFLARVISLGAAIVTVLITARTLGPEGRGHVAVFAVLVLTSSTVLGFGTGVAAYSLAALDGTSPAVIARALVSWSLGLTVVAGAIALGISWSGQLDRWLGRDADMASVLLGLGSGAQYLALALSQLATGTGRAGVTALGFGMPAVFTMVITILASLVAPGASSFMVAQVAGWMLAAVSLAAVLSVSLLPSRADIPALSVRARRAALGEVANALSYRLDILLLAAIAGPGSVGVYSLAVQVVEPVWIVATAMSSGLLLRLRHLPRPRWARVTVSRLPTAVLFSMFGVAAVIALIPLAVTYVGPGFEQTQGVAICLAPGVVALAVSKILAAYNIACGRLAMGSVVATVSVIATTALDLALIPMMGAFGAAIASSLGYGVSMLLWIVMSGLWARRPSTTAALV